MNWDAISAVAETASIVMRGRESLENLIDEECMVFEFMHIQILNTVESWYMQLMETSPPGEYREQQLENIAGVIVYILNYPGAQEIWGMVKHTFVPVQKFAGNLNERLLSGGADA